MASDDFEALGLLDGLEGDARQERIDLIAWLLDRGFDIDHIRGSVGAPLNLPAARVIGDDGTYVSAREICQSTGLELEFLQRIHSAVGLPRFEDPDARTLLRVDGEAAAQARMILDLGIDPDDVVVRSARDEGEPRSCRGGDAGSGAQGDLETRRHRDRGRRGDRGANACERHRRLRP